MVLRTRKVILAKGAKEVQTLAQKRANQRMRKEILPLLSKQHPRPSSWNPLRSEFNSPSAYGMKLWVSDALVIEILRSRELLKDTQRIVVEEVRNAALIEAKPFVTNLLSQLMSDHE